MYIEKEEHLKSSMNALFRQALLIIRNGGAVDAEVKKHENNRTREQNAYYWLVNKQIADFLDKSGLSYGEYQIPYNKDIIHEINKKLFAVKTTTRLSIGNFCEYMHRVLQFWQERTHGNFQISELPENYFERKGYVLH